MRTITLPGWFKKCEVRLYDSIKELSIERYQELQKLVLQDTGIGSDVDSVANHFSNFHKLLTNDKTQEALQEAKNLHNNIFYMIEKINIKSFCFMVMVESINGKAFTDLSEENIKRSISNLSKEGLKQSQVQDIIEDVKKNLKQSFEPIFLINSETQGSTIHLMKLKGEQKHN